VKDSTESRSATDNLGRGDSSTSGALNTSTRFIEKMSTTLFAPATVFLRGKFGQRSGSGRTHVLRTRAKQDGEDAGSAIVPFGYSPEQSDDKKNKQGLQRMSPGTGMEIVLHAARGEGDLPAPFEEPFSPLTNSSHKRRTQGLAFTCNKCGERTTRRVNPHALRTGTVFVQCAHCLVHHNLVDNLNLFDAMKGPVYKEGTTAWGGGGGVDADWEAISRMRGFSVWDKMDGEDEPTTK